MIRAETRRRATRVVALPLLLAAGAALTLGARADADGGAPAIFRDADLALGAQLLQSHRCADCHARRVGGDGAAIYNPRGRIGTPGALRGMVEQCNTELGLQLFPEEVTAIAAVLDRDHYRFGRR